MIHAPPQAPSRAPCSPASGGALTALILLCACAAPAAPAAPPPEPVSADGAVRVISEPVPLNPSDANQTRVGELIYAGGVDLTSPDTTRLHGVSGLDLAQDGRGFIAVTDEGDLVRGRLTLDENDQLTGVEQVKLTPLTGEDGRPLQGKQQADAEDAKWLPGGYAVSFERQHRVLAYAAGSVRVLFRADAAKAREMELTDNGGLEALAHDGGSLFAGSEAGRVWAIRDGAIAGPNQAPEPPPGFSLTGLDAAAGPDWVAVYRAFSPFGGGRAVIASLPAPRCIRAPCEAPHGLIELARLAPPLTVDNFEAIAAVPRPGGGWRLYIVSDDNFSSRQRTLLLAFDWLP